MGDNSENLGCRRDRPCIHQCHYTLASRYHRMVQRNGPLGYRYGVCPEPCGRSDREGTIMLAATLTAKLIRSRESRPPNPPGRRYHSSLRVVSAHVPRACLTEIAAAHPADSNIPMAIGPARFSMHACAAIWQTDINRVRLSHERTK